MDAIEVSACAYEALAIQHASELVFGRAPRPVSCGFNLTIGAGQVYPEVNFTLPAISVSGENWSEIVSQYTEMATGIIRRAVALRAPGIVLEFELLPAMTECPEWGAQITALLHHALREAHRNHGLRCALRVTPTDIREQGKPPLLRRGDGCEKLLRSFELCAQAGADILSIESIGGKEVHDQALLYGDVPGVVFALGVLAPRDMAWLWSRITAICARHPGVLPGGDTACAFANTAMQLAHQRMLPEVLAAVVRAMSAVRSLVAFEQGAIGPSKDCAYEGPVLKAITGCPISMEGKSATCAHFSPMGNVASAMCDLWSNESVQNVRLLSGSAPEAYTESLLYDCRLMNAAAERGGSLTLRDWLTASDRWFSPQAAVLSPDATIEIATAIVRAKGFYERTQAAGHAAISVIRAGLSSEAMQISAREQQWLERIERELAAIPRDEQDLRQQVDERYPGVFDPASYGLSEARV
jgi:methanol--5-hydroxybenzimidazolylcobamide Co-methyltransferase